MNCFNTYRKKFSKIIPRSILFWQFVRIYIFTPSLYHMAKCGDIYIEISKNYNILRKNFISRNRGVVINIMSI